KNLTDHADSLDHIPLRYLLAFTAVVIATSRNYLAAEGASPQQVDRMHAAFTKSVMLHVTAWTRPYVGAADWWPAAAARPSAQPAPPQPDVLSPAGQLI